MSAEIRPDYSRRSRPHGGHWKKTQLTMRQVHLAGDKLFVDYSGKRPSVIDVETGELVAVLGASNYTYAEVTRSRTVPEGG